MKTNIIIIIFLIVTIKDSKSYYGDFIVRNSSNVSISVKFQVISIPFEGSSDSSYYPELRMDQMQGGGTFKGINNNYYSIVSKFKSGTDELRGFC